MFERLTCLLFGHLRTGQLHDADIRFRPSSALGYFTLTWCYRCKQVYFRSMDVESPVYTGSVVMSVRGKPIATFGEGVGSGHKDKPVPIIEQGVERVPGTHMIRKYQPMDSKQERPPEQVDEKVFEDRNVRHPNDYYEYGPSATWVEISRPPRLVKKQMLVKTKHRKKV